MPENLSLHHNCLRNTFAAHSFRERLMIWAIVVYFVTILWKWDTILTFLVCLMLTPAFSFDSWEIMLEALMLNNPFIIFIWDTIRAFLKGWMVAWHFAIFHWMFAYTQAINALRIGTMITMTFFNLFLWKGLILILMRTSTLSSRINHHGIWLLFFFLNLWLSNTPRDYACCKLSVLICYMKHISIPIIVFI